MANIGLQVLYLLFISESCCAKAAPEDLHKAARLTLSGGTHEGADQHLTSASARDHQSARRPSRDMVSINMFKLYEKYSKEPQRERDGNTVRSFKGISKNKEWFQFNLSSIQESEHILSASFHFLHKRARHQRPPTCRRSRHPPCAPPQHQRASSPHLLIHGASRNAASTTPLGNITLAPPKRSAWQARDITAMVRRARESNALLITARLPRSDPALPEALSPPDLPYVLVFADDRAIDEPNSVALSLQRYSPSPVGEDPARPPDAGDPSAASRVRRELPRPRADQLQTNDLPEVHFNTLKNHELWQSTYFPPKAKAPMVKHGGKQGQESSEGASGKPQVLSFDERTMKKARRRQWSEPRVCARRYLRVDFADIGWSEWVLAPKSFDAYYCSGTCGFPIPKLVRPSNHATIQSIVRAVGIVPGVPEPCCVPDKMSPLAVLFLDPDRDMVLKVYPSMSVDTCSCK